MPSTHKTPHLGLNHWQASDKPKMEDFNGDNLLLDQAIAQHVAAENEHVTPQEKAFVAQPFYLGSYVGNDAAKRSITLGFRPRFVLVFADQFNIALYQSNQTQTSNYLGLACLGFSTTPLEITNQGFSVSYSSGAAPGSAVARLNAQGVNYAYLAIK